MRRENQPIDEATGMADLDLDKKLGPSSIAEIEVLWITAGLGCDGDTIAMTAATQPSIEDVVLGALPWIPKVNLHNPFLAMANGDDFMKPFHQAAEGKTEHLHSGGRRIHPQRTQQRGGILGFLGH